MSSALQTHEGGAVIVAGRRVVVLTRRHDLASHTDRAANDDRVDVAMSRVSVVALVLFALAVFAGVAACAGVWK